MMGSLPTATYLYHPKQIAISFMVLPLFIGYRDRILNGEPDILALPERVVPR